MDINTIIEKTKYFINHAYKEIIIVFLIFCSLIGLVAGLISLMMRPAGPPQVSSTSQQSHVKYPSYKIDSETKDFLLKNQFAYPQVNFIDLSNDYIDLMPLNKISKPGQEIIQEELDKLIQEAIDDTCKLNIEKRRKK